MNSPATSTHGDDGSPLDELEIATASSDHTEALLALFQRAGHPCYCRYWHHEGDANSWLAQLFHHEAENRTRMTAALAASSPEMAGMVAITQGLAVGWMKLAPSKSLPKLYAQRSVRGLPCFEDSDRARVLSIACFLVDPEWREMGVARALLAEGIVFAQEQGALAIEAFPCTTSGIPPEQLLGGPPQIFHDAGFLEVGRVAQYPVLRLTL